MVLGKNLSTLVLYAGCERARAVALDKVFFNVDAEPFDQFTKTLNAPAALNAGLQRKRPTSTSLRS